MAITIYESAQFRVTRFGSTTPAYAITDKHAHLSVAVPPMDAPIFEAWWPRNPCDADLSELLATWQEARQ